MSALANENTCTSTCGCDELCPDHGDPVVIARHLVESGHYEAVRDECRSRQGTPRPEQDGEKVRRSFREWPAVLARDAFGSRLGDGLVRKLLALTLGERGDGPLRDASTRADATDPRAYPIDPALVLAFAASVRALLDGVRDGGATIAHAHERALARRETYLSADDRRTLTRARVEARVAALEKRDPAELALHSDLMAALAAYLASDAVADCSDEQRSELLEGVVSLLVAMEPTRVEVMQVEAGLRSGLPPDVSSSFAGTPPRGFPRAGNPEPPPFEEKAA